MAHLAIIISNISLYAINVIFVVLMVYAAYSDLTSYTLPNFISLALIALFIGAALFIMPSFDVILWHVGIAVIIFIVGFILFAVNILGGGDVKVISALALWFGPNDFLAFFVLMAVFGGILALFLLVFRKIKLKESWLNNKTIKGLHDPEEGIPYGVAIAPAALIEFPKSGIYQVLSIS